jgi:hypothetical protein
MDLIETGWEEVDWIHLAQDRDQRQKNMVMKFGFHKMQEIPCLAEELLASQEEHCSM